MNREIKFRAWSEFGKKMHFISECEDLWSFLRKVHGMELMQFTGLTDKNGRQIYEGDICQIMRQKKDGFSEEGLSTVGAVQFGTVYVKDNTLFAFDTFHINERSIRYLTSFDLEVIGNIYENPELLNS